MVYVVIKPEFSLKVFWSLQKSCFGEKHSSFEVMAWGLLVLGSNG